MQKRKLFLIVTFLVSIIFFAFSQNKGDEKIVEAKFVGVSVCKPCHNLEKQGKQIDVWSKSKHSNAYKTLLTEKADSIAKAKGFKTKAVGTQECLKCHTSGHNAKKENLGEKFKIEDGIQCESCHGAASEYKMVHTKDVEKAKEKGLIMISDKAKFCTGCHNPESPTFKEFDVEKAWTLIKHFKPQIK